MYLKDRFHHLVAVGAVLHLSGSASQDILASVVSDAMCSLLESADSRCTERTGIYHHLCGDKHRLATVL